MNINKAVKKKSATAVKATNSHLNIEISMAGTGFDKFYDKCNEFNINPELLSTVDKFGINSYFTATCNGYELQKLINFAKSDRTKCNDIFKKEDVFIIWRITKDSKVVF